MDELPVVRGLMVCERVEQDRRTGNLSVSGRFTRFHAPAYPSPPRLVSVYVALTNGYGNLPVTLSVLRFADEDTTRTERRVVRFADRLAEVQLVFNLAAFSFPTTGWYEFTLYVADEPLVSQRVHAVTAPGGADAS